MKKNCIVILTLLLVLQGLFGCGTNNVNQSSNIEKIIDIKFNSSSFYIIMNHASGKYLDSKSYSADNSIILQWSATNKPDQFWQIVDDFNGFSRIICMSTNKYIAISGEKLVQTSIKDNNSLWIIKSTDNGFYKIESMVNKMCIDSQNMENDGAKIIISNSNNMKGQEWKIIKVNTFDELAAMYLGNSASNTVLSVQNIDYDSEVTTSKLEETYQNEWFIIADHNNPTTFKIKNLYSSKVLSEESGSTVVVKGEADDDSQRWELKEDLNDSYSIVNMKTGLFLTNNNRIISLSPGSNNSNQIWQILRVNSDYAVPEPKPILKNKYLVGAEMCNLWDITTRPECWNAILPYPDRKPVTGWFNEGSQKQMDWDIKMAVDNGIDFFSPCWYRAEATLGKPIDITLYEHWIDGLEKAKYKNEIKFAIHWINIPSKGLYCGIENKDDFLNNLVPYFINKFFKNPNYLVIEGKPVIEFFDAKSFIDECGGPVNAKEAISKFRQMVKNAGFKDIILIGQWCTNGNVQTHDNSDWKSIGVDYSNGYNWPSYVSGAINPKRTDEYWTDEQAIIGQQNCWDGQAKGVIPNIITATMGFDDSPWGGRMKMFRLAPKSFSKLLWNAKNLMDKRNQSNLESRLVFLDNWDEFGEGHYIYPTEQYGFGYLDEVKKIFTN